MARVEIPIVVIDTSGNAVSGASGTVKKRSDGSSATVYQAETGATTLANPLTSDSSGRFSGWVDANLRYQVDITATGVTSYTEYFDAASGDSPVADEAGLRVIRGSVTSAGAVAVGSGFSVSKTGTGTYTVTITTAFSAEPSVAICPYVSGGANGVKINSAAAGNFTVIAYTTNTAANVDCGFSFVAVGPR